MPVKSVENVSLPQVPDLDGRVIAARKQVPSIWVELDVGARGGMSIVMLNQPLTSDIPNLDGVIVGTRSDAGAVWMEFD